MKGNIMSSIKPITSFNTLASNMIKSIATDCPAKNTYVRNFYRTANETGLQGNALISYFTEIAKAQKLHKESYGKFFGIDNADKKAIKETYNRVWRFDDVMIDVVSRNSTIKEEFRKFMSALSKNYPNTMMTRSAILSQGAVVDGEVKRTSGFKKIMIKFLEALNKEE